MTAAIAASNIVQQAFRAMGIGTLSSLADTDPRVLAAAELYDSALDMTLEALDWSFASTLATISRKADSADILRDARYGYVYGLPANLLVLREVTDPDVSYRVDANVMQADYAGPLTIRYTAKVQQENTLPRTFQTAVAYQLALMMAPEHVKTARALDQLSTAFDTAFDRAARTDGTTASPRNYNQSGGGGDWLAEAIR